MFLKGSIFVNLMNAFFSALILAFGLIFIAELGDKTQLVILTIATKGYNKTSLSIGATLGFAIIVSLGGLIASIISSLIDLQWISFGSGILFIVIGGSQLLTLIRQRKAGICEATIVSDGDLPKVKSKNAIFIGLSSIVVMELGDKTQLMTIILASSSESLAGTLIGSWLALSSLAIIGAIAGELIAKKLKKEKIDLIAAILFICIGLSVIILSFS